MGPGIVQTNETTPFYGWQVGHVVRPTCVPDGLEQWMVGSGPGGWLCEWIISFNAYTENWYVRNHHDVLFNTTISLHPVSHHEFKTSPTEGNCREGRGGDFIKFSVLRCSKQKKCTQSDLKFCENEGSKRF